jgi:hypothetical protein
MQEAYELELNRELKILAESFKAWEQGEISNGELSYRIHEYDRGPSKELYKQYNRGDNAFNVAYAIVTGMLDREEIPADVMEAIQGQITFYEDLKKRDELKYPGEK